jgi:hypothetical protein
MSSKRDIEELSSTSGIERHFVEDEMNNWFIYLFEQMRWKNRQMQIHDSKKILN